MTKPVKKKSSKPKKTKPIASIGSAALTAAEKIRQASIDVRKELDKLAG